MFSTPLLRRRKSAFDPPRAGNARNRRLRLEPLEDRMLLSVFSVTTTDDGGAGSLRQALFDANAHPGADTIEFQVPGTGPHAIRPASPLPTITDPVVIDGYTQPGAQPATSTAPAELMIELDGSNASNYSGLLITSGGSTVRGLVVNRFLVGIGLASNGNNVIEGNFIGTDVTGSVRLANSRFGVELTGSHSNRIGTNGDGITDEAERNVIGLEWIGVLINRAHENVVAGNYIGTDVTGTVTFVSSENSGAVGIFIIGGSQRNRIGTDGNGLGDEAERNIVYGVGISGTRTDHNVVAGNYIGTDVTGTVAYGAKVHGVSIVNGPQFNIIGTDGDGIADEAERNIISGHGGVGVLIGNAQRNVVAGNYVGTDVTGTLDLGNGGGITNNFGGAIWLGNFARWNRIGTNGDGISDDVEGNVIAFNSSRSGVAVVGEHTIGNSIRGNSIYSNLGPGIDLGDDGVTSNDLGDADTGPNNSQNFPTISQVETGVKTRVVGNLNSTANTTFILDFYASSATAGSHQGQRLLGSTHVTTDASGNADFDNTLAAASAVGEVITTTATDPAGNTSEFSTFFTLTQTVQIDVKPGSDENPINVANDGATAVVILTDDQFDASRVDASTVVFAGAFAFQSALEDVDGDGDLDMILHFRTEETILHEIYTHLLIDDQDEDGILDTTKQEAEVSLAGDTLDSVHIEGSDNLNLFLSGKALRDLLDELF